MPVDNPSPLHRHEPFRCRVSASLCSAKHIESVGHGSIQSGFPGVATVAGEDEFPAVPPIASSDEDASPLIGDFEVVASYRT